MVREREFLRLLLLTCLTSSLLAGGEYERYVVTAPQDALVEIGTNFTATCILINTTEATADDLKWTSFNTIVPKEQYTKINNSALNVTISITSKTPEWLVCECKKPASPFVTIYRGKFMHGIRMRKGYHPEKPENLSCVAIQEGSLISPNIRCTWEPGTRESKELTTKYTLSVKKQLINDTLSVTAKQNNSGQVALNIFPNHMTLDIWVKAENELGTVESEHLIEDADWFVKTNPPVDVKVISEKSFPTSLLINWMLPIAKEYVKLIYQIRFCASGSQMWIDVPLVDTSKEIQSFRIQYLLPDTLYITQVRCKNARGGHGYWSDWSINATARTPEDEPRSKPDLWRIITTAESNNKPQMEFICKDPVFSNGRITRFDIRVQWSGRGMWESVPVNSSGTDDNFGQRKITGLKQINLPDKEAVRVEVIAHNSVGGSPKALLLIPRKSDALPPVENLTVWTHSGRLWLAWSPPNITAGRNATEYVVQWVGGMQMDWQREHGNARQSAIKGNLEKFKCYNISVYPLYSGWIGKPVTVKAFLEQGAPLEGPFVRLDGKPGRNEAQLVWEEIPLDKQRGFITNYTIFYSSGSDLHSITVPANTTSYLLKSLSSDTKYDTWIRASTIRGSASGTNHSFSTLKYAPGEIEGNVVGVCFGFLFVVLLAVILCICKKDSIKENFWPQIPNPGNSSIGAWSPDYPSKAHTPKENTLVGVSVVEVDVFDEKSVFEEDKASSPLKKDKYLSEEHSSGIGGSSCMSSPRQSVSDSDEGGDIGETTASTVQYSSVVASNGYKGQTPSSLPQRQQATFSRSESTQPLLDSEENPELSGQEGSRQSQRFPRNPCFRHSTGNEDSPNSADFNQVEIAEQRVLESLSFCPLEEDSQHTPPTEDQPFDWLQEAPVSSYMPQLGVYRQQ